MPRLLFVNKHYWPDVAATAQHLTQLAEYLVERGFEVDVLCAHGGYAEGEGGRPSEEVVNGVRIRRLRATAFGRASHLGRLVDYAGYYLGVLRALLAGPAYDLTVVLTTPPLLSYAASLAERLRGRPYAVWSMDLHPDAEVALGMLAVDSLPARRLESLNRTGYRNAQFVVDLGFRMRERIAEKGVDPSRQHTIGAWCDGEEVHPVAPAENPVREELGVDAGTVLVMYSGNAGLAHRFDEVVEAMDRLRDDDRFRFLFVGSGPRTTEVQAAAEARGLTNVAFRGYFPFEQLSQSLSAADVHLLTLREEMAGIAVPSKLYGVMATARPTVMVGPMASEPAREITAHDLGAVVDPADGDDPAGRLVHALRALADDPEERAAIGARARARFEVSHDRAVLCEAWAQRLAEATGTALGPLDASVTTTA